MRCRKYEDYPIEPKPVCRKQPIFDGLYAWCCDRKYGDEWYDWFNAGLRQPPMGRP